MPRLPRFRPDNTCGYSARDLAELNRRFDAELLRINCPDDKEALIHFVAENVRHRFDTENAPRHGFGLPTR